MMWNWKKLLLTVFLSLLGSTMIDGFTNFLGALIMAIAYSIPSYYDGKKAGGREVFELIKRK